MIEFTNLDSIQIVISPGNTGISIRDLTTPAKFLITTATKMIYAFHRDLR